LTDTTTQRTPRIPPLEAPYPEPIGELLTRMTPPQAPEILALFRVLAVNPALAERTMELGRYLLGRKAAISLRDARSSSCGSAPAAAPNTNGAFTGPDSPTPPASTTPAAA